MNLIFRAILILPIWTSVTAAPAVEQMEPVLKDRGRHYQTEGEIVPVDKDGIHDPDNPAVTVLQPPSKALAGFPRDSAGIVDWVQAVKQGMIEPRADINGLSQKQTLDLDIIFTDTGAMPHVRFTHLSHTQWLDCSNCHPAIFVQQKGANKITMNDILQGKNCGVCHGKVAFPPTLNCARCHSVPKTDGKQ
jgi:c(7)-type cytochrome triheme protein